MQEPLIQAKGVMATGNKIFIEAHDGNIENNQGGTLAANEYLQGIATGNISK